MPNSSKMALQLHSDDPGCSDTAAVDTDTNSNSNATEEHVFSMVRKNKTPFRSNSDLDKTLGSIITTKMALPQDTPVNKFEPPKELLVSAKKETRQYNQAHSSKT